MTNSPPEKPEIIVDLCAHFIKSEPGKKLIVDVLVDFLKSDSGRDVVAKLTPAPVVDEDRWIRYQCTVCANDEGRKGVPCFLEMRPRPGIDPGLYDIPDTCPFRSENPVWDQVPAQKPVSITDYGGK